MIASAVFFADSLELRAARVLSVSHLYLVYAYSTSGEGESLSG
jgi:hypothetical protein